MFKSLQRAIFYMLLIILSLALIKPTNSIENAAFKRSSWGFYHKNAPHVILSNTNNSNQHQIQFISSLYAENVVRDDLYDGNKTSYRKLTLTRKLNAKASSSDKTIEIVSGRDTLYVRLNHTQQQLERVVVNLELWQSSSFYLFKNDQQLNQNNVTILAINNTSVQFECDFDLLIISPVPKLIFDDFSSKSLSSLITQIKVQYTKKIQNLIKKHEITYFEEEQKYAKYLVGCTLKSICVMETEFDKYYGLCYNKHESNTKKEDEYEMDVRYSGVVIEILLTYDMGLGLWLFQNLFSYLQQRLFYREEAFIEIPQRISIIKSYLDILHLYINSPSEAELQVQLAALQQLHVKIKSVLNGLINQMLLSDVNSLEEEINYRENKKIHPSIMKMLTLNWKSHSLKNVISSVYEESFMPDYFYNSANQKLENSVAKISWLIQVSLQFTHFIRRVGTAQDIASLDQIYSLVKILVNFANDDKHAKLGKFYSISRSEGTRLYITQVGYESLLPYAYEITNIFPSEMLQNITTPFGIASLNLNHPRKSSHYEFRGNIHLYFNYVILEKYFTAVKSNTQSKEYLQVVSLIHNVKQNIQAEIRRHQEQKSQSAFISYTLWDSEGKGLRNRELLSIVQLMFFKKQYQKIDSPDKILSGEEARAGGVSTSQ